MLAAVENIKEEEEEQQQQQQQQEEGIERWHGAIVTIGRIKNDVLVLKTSRRKRRPRKKRSKRFKSDIHLKQALAE